MDFFTNRTVNCGPIDGSVTDVTVQMKRKLLENSATKYRSLVILLIAGLNQQVWADQGNCVPADAIYLNGKVYTVSAKNPWAEAAAVRDGRFVYVGGADQILELVCRGATQYDLKGKLVLPGLIDAHTHPGMVASTNQPKIINRKFLGPGLVSESKEEFLALVKEYAEANPGLPYIYAGFFSPEAFGQAGPSRHDLDRIVPDRPVILVDDWRHSHWANSIALKIAGVDRNTPDPIPGYSFYPRDENGEPTGWLVELAAEPVRIKLIPGSVSPEILTRFFDFLLSQGVTTLYDAGNIGFEDIVYGAVADLQKQGKLPLRYEGSYHITLPDQFSKAVKEVRRLQETYSGGHLNINSVKIHFDGVPTLHTSAMLEPYADAPDKRGGMIQTSEQLSGFILELNAEKINLHIHTVGDRAIRTVLDAVELARSRTGGPLSIRVTLAHVSILHDDDAARFKELEVGANMTPYWNTITDEVEKKYEKLLGKDRGGKLLRAQPILRTGGSVSFASDIVIEESIPYSSPYVGIQIGHTRQAPLLGPNGKIFKPLDERLPLEDLVEGYTLSGAWQLGLDKQLGSIEAGKRADFVVLGQNIFAVDPYTLSQSKPLAVLMDGELVVGKFPLD